jgi:hypothetical protein
LSDKLSLRRARLPCGFAFPNYNPDAEARAGRSGMATLARYLGAELDRLFRRHTAAD